MPVQAILVDWLLSVFQEVPQTHCHFVFSSLKSWTLFLLNRYSSAFTNVLMTIVVETKTLPKTVKSQLKEATKNLNGDSYPKLK